MSTITSIEHALEILGNEEKMDSAEWQMAMVYLLENAPPDIMDQLRVIRQKYFPGLVLSFVDEHGNGFFPLDVLCRELGLSPEQVKEELQKIEREHQGTGLSAVYCPVGRIFPVQ